VLITGGSEGLGKSMAIKFAKLGSNVTIISRNEEKLRIAKKEIEAARVDASQKVITLSADVTIFRDIENAVKISIKENGVVDLLITNAGQSLPGYFIDIPVETMEKEVRLNYLGTLYTIKAALPSMVQRNQGGHLLLISTAAAFTNFIGYTNYGATKSAVKSLAEGLRNEMNLYDIGVSIFFPTGISTPGMTEEDKTKPPETRAIEGSSSLNSPDYCAQCVVDGLKNGRYAITSEIFPTIALRMLSLGVTFRDSILLDVILTPLCILICPIFVYIMDSTVQSSSRKSSKKSN